jgi:hypothetical protein
MNNSYTIEWDINIDELPYKIQSLVKDCVFIAKVVKRAVTIYDYLKRATEDTYLVQRVIFFKVGYNNKSIFPVCIPLTVYGNYHAESKELVNKIEAIKLLHAL